MTHITVNIQVPTATGTKPATGYLVWTPTRRRYTPTTITLPTAFTVRLVDGKASFTVDPTTAEWLWRVDEVFDHQPPATVYVTVHGDTANYSALVRVDPLTLEPYAEPAALWWETANNTVQDAALSGDNLVFTRYNGETVNVGNVRGRPGTPGQRGQQGIPGVDGIDGTDGLDGVDGGTNELTAQHISEPGPTQTALNATIAEQIASDGTIVAAAEAAVDDAVAGLNISGAEFQTAMSYFWAGIAKSETAPAAIVTAGDSLTYNNGTAISDSGWVPRFARRLSTEFPDSALTYQPVAEEEVLAPLTTAGLHVYNIAIGGRTSYNYLTGQKQTNAIAAKPCLVVHMVGINNQNFTTTTAASVANDIGNMITAIDNGLATASAPPCGHLVLVEPGQATDPSGKFIWNDYRAALKTMVDARANVAILDVDAIFRPLVAGNLYALKTSDGIHMEPAGNSVLANTVFNGVTATTPQVGYSAATTSAGGGTSDTTAPTAPTNLTGTATDTTMALAWTASTDDVGVTAYRVSQDNGATWVASTVTGTSYTVNGLTASTSYTFAVQAGDAAGNWSTSATLTQSTSAPTSSEAPTGTTTTLSDTFTRTVSASWGSADTGQTYDVSEYAGSTAVAVADGVGRVPGGNTKAIRVDTALANLDVAFSMRNQGTAAFSFIIGGVEFVIWGASGEISAGTSGTKVAITGWVASTLLPYRVVLQGGTFWVYANGTKVTLTPTPTATGATTIGFRSYGGNAEVDGLIVKSFA